MYVVCFHKNFTAESKVEQLSRSLKQVDLCVQFLCSVKLFLFCIIKRTFDSVAEQMQHICRN